jgi:hypothetical protein
MIMRNPLVASEDSHAETQGHLERGCSLLTAAVLFFTLLASVGCQQRVIRETSYSPEQFPQYSHLPRASDQREEQGTDWVGETAGTVKQWGNTATGKVKSLGRTIGGWVPSWGDE